MKTGQNSQNSLKIYCSSNHLISTHEIARSWSADKKYLAVSWTGEKFLLRINNTRERKVSAQTAGFCRTQNTGDTRTPDSKSNRSDLQQQRRNYLHASVLDTAGRDLADVIQNLLPEEQYRLGIAAGKILRQLHTIPASDGIPRWEEWFSQKMDLRTKAYTA